jgi:hypothetical protein
MATVALSELSEPPSDEVVYDVSRAVWMHRDERTWPARLTRCVLVCWLCAAAVVLCVWVGWRVAEWEGGCVCVRVVVWVNEWAGVRVRVRVHVGVCTSSRTLQYQCTFLNHAGGKVSF